jgi:hypothetical protein
MTTTTLMWIGGHKAASDGLNVGDPAFLVHISNAINGSERYELRDRPAYTNESHQPRPRGWCGSWNNVSTDGLGVWRVAKIAKNGRVQISEVVDRAELAIFLDEYGYPNLLGACLPATAKS